MPSTSSASSAEEAAAVEESGGADGDSTGLNDGGLDAGLAMRKVSESRRPKMDNAEPLPSSNGGMGDTLSPDAGPFVVRLTP
jgi:hypothetical protein